MFVRYYLELALPPAVAVRALLRDPEAWMPGLVFDAESHGEAMIGELDFGPVHKRVEILLSDPVRLPSKTVLPMTWRAASGPALFPIFEADVEIAELEAEKIQLSISARYKPPLGALGKAIDRALLHRVAETTVKDFLDHVGEKLESLAGGASAVQR